MKYKVGDIVVLDYPEYFEVGKPYTIRKYTDVDTYGYFETSFLSMEKRIIGYYKPFTNYLKKL